MQDNTGPLEPGRELDRLIAEQVMGLLPLPADRCPVCGWPFQPLYCQPGDCSQRPAPARRADEPAPYSTDINAAFQVVEHLRAKWAPDAEPYYWQFEDCGTHGWVARIVWDHHDGPIVAFEGDAGERLPLAICHAALVAVEEAPHAG